jgi:clan AA aspartic protease (TIGR02281 family)
MEGDAPLVDLSLNGRTVQFILDTGASTTLLTEDGAKKLGLKPVQVNGITFYGVGGSSVARRARIKEFKLGSAVLHDVDLFVTGSMRSGHAVGLLGRDVLLSKTDLELDLANHVVRMLKAKDCQGDDVVYWAKSYSMASINSRSTAILLNASLNGRSISAELDSGSDRSIVTLDAAHRAGVTPQSHGVAAIGASSGMGGDVQTWTGTFQALGVGGEIVQNAKLQLADLFSKGREVSTGSILHTDVVESPDMLLGADFIKAHRIYIAPNQNKVYFTYNGGPIFQLPTEDKAPDKTAAH